MLELVLLLGYVAAIVVVAHRAFVRPCGTYWRSAASVLGVAVAAGVLWQLASPSNEAGFGFFVIWCGLVALTLLGAIVASLAATARHIIDASGARA
jgi:hypothetical protein